MFEKVNPCHPDKVADRIAGALVDLAYKKSENPRIAVEVLIGHGVCHIIAETSAPLDKADVTAAVRRIAGNLTVDYAEVPQDGHLADNQANGIRCGDNGIFKGMPVTAEQRKLSKIARDIFKVYPYDGKYILDGDRLILCQSNASTQRLREIYPNAEINPLGDWTGGTDVDTGATNRKLGSDMADSITGGGLHGKDLSCRPPPVTESAISEPSLRLVAPVSTSVPPVQSPSGLISALGYRFRSASEDALL